MLFWLAPLKAQQTYTLTGVVKNDKGELLSGATVFLDNTKKITSTTDDGEFTLEKLQPGTFELVVKMMGYKTYSTNIILRPQPAVMPITLEALSIDLNEVKITATDPDWGKKYSLFKENFLGLTKSGRNCKILNPKVLVLKFNRRINVLAGHSRDFLIIENPVLGYRIKYLLRTFEYNYAVGITNYRGVTLFEELQGTEKQRAEWQNNRLKAYNNSLTNFLKLVYAGKDEPQAAGFITGRLLEKSTDLKADGLNGRMRPQLMVDDRPIQFDSLVSVVDSSLISFKFRSPLVINYAPEFVKRNTNPYQGTSRFIPLNNNTTSVLQLALKEALIDSKGNFTDYRAFLIRGHWAELRIGDQLPLDYQP